MGLIHRYTKTNLKLARSESRGGGVKVVFTMEHCHDRSRKKRIEQIYLSLVTVEGQWENLKLKTSQEICMKDG